MGKTKVPPHCHLSNNWHSAKRKFHYDKDFQTKATIIKDFSVSKKTRINFLNLLLFPDSGYRSTPTLRFVCYIFCFVLCDGKKVVYAC